jgi:MFS transporter, DHA3 family, macrolide efflux protein
LLIIGAIAVIWATDFSVTLVYVVVLSLTTVRVFRTPALQASIPLLVTKKQLARANSLFELGLSGSQILGAAIGGALIAAGLDIIDFFVINVSSFLFAAFVLFLVNIPRPQTLASTEEKEETAETKEKRYLTDLTDGIHYLWTRRVLFWLMGVAMIVNLLSSGLNVLLPQLVTEKFQGGPELFGIVSAALSAGSLIGGMFLLVWGGPKQKIKGFLLALLVASLFQIGAGLVTMWMLVAIALGGAVANWMVADTLGTTVFQEMTPPNMQGRIFALRRSLEQFTWPLSLLFTGLLVPSVMPADLFLVIAGGASLLVVVIMLWSLRVSRQSVPSYSGSETGE